MKKSLKGVHSTFIDGAEDFIKVLEKNKITDLLDISFTHSVVTKQGCTSRCYDSRFAC